MTDYYTCGDCGGYTLRCGCAEKRCAEQTAKRKRRETSRVTTWRAHGVFFETSVAANHIGEAIELGRAAFGDKLQRITKTVTETVWGARVSSLRVEVVPVKDGHRYRLFDTDNNLLIESGSFASPADALKVGTHFANDPASIFDFIQRKTP